MAYLTPFLSNIFGKFTVNVPNVPGWVAQVWVNCPKYNLFSFFGGGRPLQMSCSNLWCHPFQYLKNSSSLSVKKLLLLIANCYWPKVNLRSFEWESIQTRARNSLLIAPNNPTRDVLPPLCWTPSSIVGNIGWYEEFQLRQSRTL